MNAKLTIIYTVKADSDLDLPITEDEQPMRGVITADVTDSSVHHWFKLFEWALSAAGFSDANIMDGACRLAFNESRKDAEMQALYDEYELGDFQPQRKPAAKKPTPSEARLHEASSCKAA